MKETPKLIYLTPDDEDPDYIVWQNHQPSDHDNGIEYVRKDVVDEALASQHLDDSFGLRKAIKTLRAHNHLRNDTDAYLNEVCAYALGEVDTEPQPEDYGL